MHLKLADLDAHHTFFWSLISEMAVRASCNVPCVIGRSNSSVDCSFFVTVVLELVCYFICNL